ncbi:hypothetical protein D3C72_315710 [compost metagenome]
MSPPDSKAAEAAEKFARIETVVLDPRCSPLMVAVLVALSNYANSRRVAWPSYETLAFITGGAVQNVRIAVEKLEALAYITVARDNQPGRSKVNRYTLQPPRCAAPIRALREALDEHRTKEKEARQRSPSGGEKEARQRAKGARVRVITGMLACPDPSERSLPDDPSSDPNGSGARQLAPGSSRIWTGSEGDPLPPDFPDAEAMSSMRLDMEIEGVALDLEAERRAFRSHHCAVRCLQRDWNRSWEIWIEKAITREQAA